MSDEYDVVISGISGKFPQASDLGELKERLLEQRNLVTEENCRWNIEDELWNIPRATGKVNFVQKFDNTFFGIHWRIAEIMDPLIRVIIERTYEAVMDAGITLKDLRGSNTGVYTASCHSDSATVGSVDTTTSKVWLIGSVRAMLANRISYNLDLQGPSWTIDSTWIGGIECLRQAVDDIRKGRIESALVGVTNVITSQNMSTLWNSLGKLSQNGDCKPFEMDANGYGRSDSVVVLFLQRSSEAKRSYASVINVDTSFLGTNAITLLKPDESDLTNFLKNFYHQCGVPTDDVAYIEAYGSADKYFDEIEMNSVEKVLCQNQRKTDLLIGCVKSNLGHTEGASCLVSIAKALIATDTGVIPPNLSYSNPNKNIKLLLDDNHRAKIITKPTALPVDKYVAVNTIGYSPCTGHVLLKQNPKSKLLITESKEQISRLVLVSARNEAGILNMIEKIESMPYDPEYYALINDVFREHIPGHMYKGFTILGSLEKRLHFTLETGSINKTSVWYVFAGMGSQWPGMGYDLMNLPVFAKAINELDSYLAPLGIDIVNIITSFDPLVLEDIINSFVGISAIQIGIVDVLKSLGIEPEGMIGHSLGENGCAYADGGFTKYQAIMAAYYRGKVASTISVNAGLMAAIGLGHDQIKNLPENVTVACHNSADSSTISGAYEEVEQYIEDMKIKKIFARVVKSNNIAFHSKHVAPLAPHLFERLKKIIPDPKKRSARWLSTSVPETDWDTEDAEYCSAKYITNNFQNPVLFAEMLPRIPKEAVVIEISPNGLFQGILKRTLDASCFIVTTGKRLASSPMNFLLSTIGKLYVVGLNPKVNAIYSPLEYPVSRNTPSIANLVTWNHETTWKFEKFDYKTRMKAKEISLNDRRWKYLTNSKLKNSVFVPLPLLLTEIHEALLKPEPILIYEDIEVIEIVKVPENGDCVTIKPEVQSGTGYFELLKDGSIALKGILTSRTESEATLLQPVVGLEMDELSAFEENEIIEIFELYRFKFSKKLCSIKKIVFTSTGFEATVIWNDNVSFLINSVINARLFYDTCTNGLNIAEVKSILRLLVDVNKFKDMELDTEINIVYEKSTNIIYGAGINVFGLQTVFATTDEENTVPFQDIKFLQYIDPPLQTVEQFLSIGAQIIGESFSTKVVESLPILVCVMNNIVSQYKPELKYLLKELHQELPRSQIFLKYLDQKESEVYSKNVIKFNKFIFVCADTDQYQPQISELVSHVDNVFIFSFSSFQNNIESLSLIASKTFNNTTFQLFKNKVSVEVNIVSIDPRNEKMWLDDLEDALLEVDSVKPVVIEWYSNSIVDIEDVINKINSLGLSQRIRFLISLNENLITENSISTKLYPNQLEKGLLINVYKDGEWGGVRHLPVPKISTNFSYINEFLRRIKRIKNTDIMYVSVDDESVIDRNTLQSDYFEFSGINAEKKKIMGIAKLNTRNEPIPLFSWTIPESWSLEDGVTVPLTYAKVMYALIVKGRLCNGSKIFVHSGYTMVGEAAIQIALHMDCEVFTTAETYKQTNYIRQRFKDCDHLLIYQSDNYNNLDSEILRMTKGKGIDIVINAETETEVSNSFRCLTLNGSFLQLSSNVLKQKPQIGMEPFIKNLTIFGITNLELLNLDHESRKEIQNLVYETLNIGVIKPFRKIVYDSRNEQQIYRSLTGDNRSRKIVIKQPTTDLKSTTDTFVCDPNKSYFIIGDKNFIWLKIVTWLLSHNAKKLVFMENELLNPDNPCQKLFNILLEKYSDLSLAYLSIDYAKHRDSASEAINIINNNAPLDVAICISLDSIRMSNVEYGIRKFGSSLRQLVCLQCDAARICEAREHESQPVLNVFWDESSSCTTCINNIDYLLINCLRINSPLMKLEGDTINNDVLHMHHLVSFLVLNCEVDDSETENNYFEKVTSMCTFYSPKTELPPVFIIPGTSVEKLKPLIRRIMYPVYCAKLSAGYSAARNIASSLIKPLKEIQSNNGPFTIIGESWGGTVALELVSMLEENYEASVQLILLEAIPRDLRKLLTVFGPSGSQTFTKNLKKYYYELTKEKDKDTSEEDKAKSVNIITNKLASVYNNFSSNPIIRSNSVIAVKLKGEFPQQTNINFNEDYGQDLNLKFLNETSYDHLIDCSVVAQIINSNVLFKWQ